MGNQEELAFFRLEGARKYLECIGNWQCFGDVETRRSLVLEGLMLMGEDKQTYILRPRKGSGLSLRGILWVWGVGGIQNCGSQGRLLRGSAD